MARLIPSDLSRQILDNDLSAEMQTLRLLTALPDDYRVFHGLHWSREGRKYTVFGEIDFVLVNNSGEILVIEQKNGGLEEASSGLMKRYSSGPKPVAEQIHRSIDGIRKKFQYMNPDLPGLEINYLLFCPDHRLLGVNAPGLDASRIVDASKVEHFISAIQELLGPGNPGSGGQCERVVEFFAQSLDLVPDVSTYISSHQRTFTRIQSDLARLVDQLEMEPLRLRIRGTAGSGKSQVALHFCSKAKAGGRTLFLCFNNPLAQRMRSLVAEDVTVDTYHGLLHRVLKEHGLEISFSGADSNPEFWPGVQERVLGLDLEESEKYDRLVVDEGQDFTQEWWEILRLFLNQGASVLWLEDESQDLYGRGSVELDGFISYRDPRNFRSPASIAKNIRRVTGVEFEGANHLPGLGAQTHVYKTPEEQLSLVGSRVSELVRQGFRAEDIALVSCSGAMRAGFASCDNLGALKLRRYTGEYDENSRQVYTDGNLIAESIYRFKGQQAPAILLMDIDEAMAKDERAARRLFCGMTRAMVRLDMFVHEASPWKKHLERAFS